MNDEQIKKRNTAFKIRIGDILIGKPTIEEEKFRFLDLGDRKIVRVNIIGNVVEKFESSGEKKYSSITIDDGSGQIRIKMFGDDTHLAEGINQGQTILVIGNLRTWNDEMYILPEILKDFDTRYLVVRKLETEKEKGKNVESLGKTQITAIKDRILGSIKNSEEFGGIEIEKLTNELADVSSIIIQQEIQKLLEEGIIFEPRPGKVRYLG